MLTHKSLLDAYVHAKDNCCPELIIDIFEPNAVLTIAVAGEVVSFPPLVVGAEGIAQTLVVDFAKRFGQCRTYYVDGGLGQAGEHGEHAKVGDNIAQLPWLVLMREAASGALCIGRGHYDWQFSRTAEGPRIAAMHIRIDRMDKLPDSSSGLIRTLQSFLPYPWVSPELLQDAFGPIARCNPAFAFVGEFLPSRFDRSGAADVSHVFDSFNTSATAAATA